jgi:hypothetical protein
MRAGTETLLPWPVMVKICWRRARPTGDSVMTTSDPKEISRLYGALNERILAKDKEGTIEVYYELLRLGQPLSQIMARSERSEDGPEAGAPSLADEASAAGADANILDEPSTPGSPRAEPARIAERASGIIAEHAAEHRDWAIDDAAPGNALPIAGDTGNQLSGPANITPDAQPESHLVARARLSPIVLYGLAAGAIVAVAGAGVLLLHPAAQKITPGGPPASETAVSSRVGTSPTADAAATPPAPAAAASDAATQGASTAGPEPAPVVSAVAAPPYAETAPVAQPVPAAPAREGIAAVAAPAPPSAETAPGAQPVPEAPAREGIAAVAAPAPAAAPAEPVPTALPVPASPTPKAPPGIAAPTSKTPPDRLRPASTEIAALLARGDGLLGVGDIASARLFYERASDAGNGRAAMRLGATYDPGFLDQVHLPNVNGDVAQALSWYRRARDLGESEAERWIQALESKSGR